MFNVVNDPGEKTDLATRQPDRVKDLRGRLEAWRKETDANMPRPKPAGQAVVPAAPDAQGDFAVVARARVEKLDIGYRPGAEPKQVGFAFKQLEQPVTGAITFKIRCASAPGHAFPKDHEVGFLVLEAADQRLEMKLKRRLQQITHVGYSSLDAVTDFSKWEQQ